MSWNNYSLNAEKISLAKFPFSIEIVDPKREVENHQAKALKIIFQQVGMRLQLISIFGIFKC